MGQPKFGFMQKEVSRGEFLSLIGLSILSILGLETLLGLITGKSFDVRHMVSGYGSSTYGKKRPL